MLHQIPWAGHLAGCLLLHLLHVAALMRCPISQDAGLGRAPGGRRAHPRRSPTPLSRGVSYVHASRDP